MALLIGRIRNAFTLKKKSTQDVLAALSTLFLVLARVLAVAGTVAGVVARRRRSQRSASPGRSRSPAMNAPQVQTPFLNPRGSTQS